MKIKNRILLAILVLVLLSPSITKANGWFESTSFASIWHKIIETPVFETLTKAFKSFFKIDSEPKTQIVESKEEEKLNPITTDLERGSMNDDVLTLQKILAREGYLSPNSITGLFTGTTEKALISFEEENGLKVSGKISGETLDNINNLIEGKEIISKEKIFTPAKKTVLQKNVSPSTKNPVNQSNIQLKNTDKVSIPNPISKVPDPIAIKKEVTPILDKPVNTAKLEIIPEQRAAVDNTPPTTPSNLRVTSSDQNSITISWTPSTDISGVKEYRIFNPSNNLISTANQNSFRNSNLLSAQTYRYYVVAVDRYENKSAPSAIITATTLSLDDDEKTSNTLTENEDAQSPILQSGLKALSFSNDRIGTRGPVQDFSLVMRPETKDKTVRLTNNGRYALTNFTPPSLSGPYSFKGGSYPGVGGNCSSVIAIGASCNIVITFDSSVSDSSATNQSADLNGQSIEALRYDSFITFSYKENNIQKNDEIRLTALSPTPAELELAILPVLDLKSPYNFGPSLVGATSIRRITVRTKSNGMIAKKFSFETLSPPYSVIKNECTETIVYETPCNIYVKFISTARSSPSKMNFRFNDGTKDSTSSIALEGSGFFPNPSQNMLIVYNDKSQNSIDLKDHYTRNRPSISSANVLAISYPSSCTEICEEADGEFITPSDFASVLQNPISTWINNSGKRIQTIVMMYGVPSRIQGSTGNVPINLNQSLGDVLITYMNMGSLDATMGYIDKFKGTNGVVVSGSQNGKSGSLYIIDRILDNESKREKDDMAKINENTVVKITSKDSAISNITESNVAGFTSFGVHGGRPSNYPTNGSISFSGNSGWYLIKTWESFNGQRDTSQGNFVKWFSKNAFGGANYDKTPIGAVTHTDEPGYDGVNSPGYMSCWESGQLFINCAWDSRRSGLLMVVGDPWVTK